MKKIFVILFFIFLLTDKSFASSDVVYLQPSEYYFYNNPEPINEYLDKINNKNKNSDLNDDLYIDDFVTDSKIEKNFCNFINNKINNKNLNFFSTNFDD